jgi:hypothetical protein
LEGEFEASNDILTKKKEWKKCEKLLIEEFIGITDRVRARGEIIIEERIFAKKKMVLDVKKIIFIREISLKNKLSKHPYIVVGTDKDKKESKDEFGILFCAGLTPKELAEEQASVSASFSRIRFIGNASISSGFRIIEATPIEYNGFTIRVSCSTDNLSGISGKINFSVWEPKMLKMFSGGAKYEGEVVQSWADQNIGSFEEKNSTLGYTDPAERDICESILNCRLVKEETFCRAFESISRGLVCAKKGHAYSNTNDEASLTSSISEHADSVDEFIRRQMIGRGWQAFNKIFMSFTRGIENNLIKLGNPVYEDFEIYDIPDLITTGEDCLDYDEKYARELFEEELRNSKNDENNITRGTEIMRDVVGEIEVSPSTVSIWTNPSSVVDKDMYIKVNSKAGEKESIATVIREVRGMLTTNIRKNLTGLEMACVLASVSIQNLRSFRSNSMSSFVSGSLSDNRFVTEMRKLKSREKKSIATIPEMGTVVTSSGNREEEREELNDDDINALFDSMF